MLNLKNTLDGYLKNVEVVGNTIQNTNNLADIRSVGDKLEGQELYKIDVVSCGKNLFDGSINRYDARVSTVNGYNYECAGYSTTNYIKVKGNTPYTVQTGQDYYYAVYDKDKKHIGGNKSSSTIWLSEEVEYIRFDFVSSNINTIQIEEGTVATPYEPYQEQKLEILSPVQLEKVGDVADRIICKDGVWGVEKNIETIYYKDLTNFSQVLSNNNYLFVQGEYTDITAFKYNANGSNTLCSKLFLHSFEESEHMWFDGITNTFRYSVSKAKVSKIDNNELIKYFTEENVFMKVQLIQPQFIPLPHDQQVKLRTFAGQTNIAFLTEIPGQIKAQVPKSLGAVVNTHTEQIEMLHNALKSVLAGDMYSLATILYPEDFEQNDNTEQDIMVIPE